MLKIIKHPLIDIKLTKMRDEKTSHKDFRENLNEISSLMAYEFLKKYKTKKKKVTTPTNTVFNGKTFDKEIVLVPILRAGIGMVEGIQNVIHQVRIGHIGLYRNEKTFEIFEYFYKIPDVPKDSEIIILDPMLATAASAIETINKLKKDGFTNIKLICLLGSPEGVKKLEEVHPNVDLYLAALDKKLNEKKYIIPGLGDAGDRIFGTK